MIAVISILQASKIRGEREFAMNTNTINSKKAIPGVNDVATKCPMAAAMWSDKNAFTPSEAPAGSHKRPFLYVLIADKSLSLPFAMSSTL